jgi:hypothetical protein
MLKASVFEYAERNGSNRVFSTENKSAIKMLVYQPLQKHNSSVTFPETRGLQGNSINWICRQFMGDFGLPSVSR